MQFDYGKSIFRLKIEFLSLLVSRHMYVREVGMWVVAHMSQPGKDPGCLSGKLPSPALWGQLGKCKNNFQSFLDCSAWF